MVKMLMTTATTKRLSAQQVGLKYGFRSGLEKDTAADLQQTGVDFSYERIKIAYEKPARASKYTPDFVITTRLDGTPKKRPLIVETKGRFLTADRQKHLLIRRQHPEWDIRFLFDNPNAKISKTSKTTYAKWCDKHGFEYAKARAKARGPVVVPRAWLEEE